MLATASSAAIENTMTSPACTRAPVGTVAVNELAVGAVVSMTRVFTVNEVAPVRAFPAKSTNGKAYLNGPDGSEAPTTTVYTRVTGPVPLLEVRVS